METKTTEKNVIQNRFLVTKVAYDNPIPVTDNTPINSRRSSRLNLQEILQNIMPRRESSARKSSRSNSMFLDFFKDTDRAVMDFSQEAAPRLENYRNSLTMHSYIVRPSLDQLHQEQQECHPALTEGKGRKEGTLKFGWVKGVYIRCLLNIWGVMLFLRMGWMTGHCGIILSVVVVLLSTVVTIITTVSMSAICTNGDVRGGGAYYLISRSLGPEFGGVVGIVLFLANAVSGAMYIVGAGEAVSGILKEYDVGIVDIPSSINDIRISGVIILVLMMSVTGVGMAFENKTQMLLLIILLVAMIDYFVGTFMPPTVQEKARGFVGWDVSVGKANLWPAFRDETFFSVFAVFFPSVTGIYAGANISGDLKDPCSAIPKGTLLSILTTSVSYVMIVFWLGFTVTREATGDSNDIFNGTFNFDNCTHVACDYGLLKDYEVMKISSGTSFLIYAGIFAATLSSALVSIISAPRILQALCVDGIIPWITWFGKGYGTDNDPRRALVLTFFIALVFTVIGDLNTIAPYISNFFMAANGLINFACFHASYIKSPGFRPGFKYYNLWCSLLGSLLCAIFMFVMDWKTAVATDVIVIALYVYISKTCPEINWGSSFQGYAYRNALYYINKLSKVEEHVKNYRPAILVLTGNASSRPQLVDFANNLTKDHGLLICGHIAKSPQDWNRRRKLNHLNNLWLNERHSKSFYSLIESDSLYNGVACLLQVSGLGKMRPNILLMGFKETWNTCDKNELLDYFKIIHEVLDAHLSLCILKLPGGTDYSRYLETPDGLPKVLEGKRKISRKKRKLRNNKVDIVVTLETVVEESHSSISSAPTVVVGDHLANQSSLTSLADVWQQSDDTERSALESEESDNGSLKQEMVTAPNHIMETINMFLEKQKEGTIDVWWLYDTGGLTLLLPYILTTRSKYNDCKLRVFSVAQDDRIISDEQLNLAALLRKFRIPFSDLTVLSSMGESPNEQSAQRFEKIMMKWIVKDENQTDPAFVTRNDLNTYRKKTNQHLRLRQLLEKHSKEANLIIITLPVPRKHGCPASLYMAWLDILTYDMPPCLLVRGNQTTVLTFYS